MGKKALHAGAISGWITRKPQARSPQCRDPSGESAEIKRDISMDSAEKRHQRRGTERTTGKAGSLYTKNMAVKNAIECFEHWQQDVSWSSHGPKQRRNRRKKGSTIATGEGGSRKKVKKKQKKNEAHVYASNESIAMHSELLLVYRN